MAIARQEFALASFFPRVVPARSRDDEIASGADSILWRAVAAIGSHLSPALVDRDLAIIYTLVVFPFLAEAFLSSESFGLIRRRNCNRGLTRVGLANHLGTDIKGSQGGGHQRHCKRII